MSRRKKKVKHQHAPACACTVEKARAEGIRALKEEPK